ncbi:HNH endonuclease signature motif containing protein [Nesterenkonia ebinurensis]|uniref:HNH endonuclease signature motif containing protein n=1 Tax=Nesterenkonia ebinurensis TaxID=2608252 RepID=UPI00123D236B|nr:HNH endonuclease signature motif containing protein [Nesterenkonia ebinurensis]
MGKEPRQAHSEGYGTAADPAVVPQSPAQPLMAPRALPGWQMERDLRIAQAAQFIWMLHLRDQYVREADEASRQELDSALKREAGSHEIHWLKHTAQHRAGEAARAAEMHIAQAVGRSEYVVAQQINAAQRAKSQLPRVWQAFATGRICQLRLHRITTTLQKLRTPEAVEKLDEQAPEYAETHRLGQVKDWLRRFEHIAEPIQAAERFAAAARSRSVRVTDVDDGMSLLSALLPTVTAHLIKRQLDATARSATEHVPHNPLIAESTTELQHQRNDLHLAWATGDPEQVPIEQVPAELNHPDVTAGFSIGGTQDGEQLRAPALHLLDHSPNDDADELPSAIEPPRRFHELPTAREDGDPRSMDQRAADALCAWLLAAQTPEELQTAAQIGILVDEATLTGASDQPGFTRDGKIPIPARNIRDWLIAQTDQLDWYQLIHRPPHTQDDLGALPTGKNLLAIHSEGRYPPERLRVALWFRDRTCTAYGCSVPAEHCDADHMTPWPDGETQAENLQLLCRRHHRLKSWGYEVHAPPLRADFVQAA